ncbi:hypothetical protein AWH69_07665 [Janibacter melonis]|uniref:UmuC domain-containing protein n=1 Tax=Janibacter melonis TaxID=262209 RepID=A0A176QE22_9MICO|nr:DNA polymerase Y family protein [Janibacter melonis]OAB87890.1 hypothetical protein AWH69_07665 [Janibacter melonis]
MARAAVRTGTTALASGGRRLVLWCPDWPVRAAVWDAGEGSPLRLSEPIGLVAKGEIHACSAAARGLGVRRGLRVREAQSRCPELLTLTHDPGADERLFASLLPDLEEVVAGVEVVRPGTATLVVDGPARFHGGEVPVGALLCERLVGRGVDDVRAGVADTVFAAEQVARVTDAQDCAALPGEQTADFLAPLPVTALGEPDLADLWRRLGLRTLGDLALLDEADVRARFGERGVRCHRTARGLEDATFLPRRPPATHEESAHFEHALRRAEQVVTGAGAAAQRLVDSLEREHLVCTAVWVEVVTDSGRTLQRRWAHPRFFDAAALLDRLAWTLDAEAPGAPVSEVRLVPDETADVTAVADGLWSDPAGEQVRQAASRIQSALGHDAVGRPEPVGGRGPAERQRLVPWGVAAPRVVDAPWPGHLPAPAPASVYTAPAPAELLDRGGHLVGVTERGAVSASPATVRATPGGPARPVQGWAGPWPADERWWTPDGRRTARLQVVDVTGQAWLLLHADGQWWTEARYD